jgi:ATP-dependent protease ClpP protease subunit
MGKLSTTQQSSGYTLKANKKKKHADLEIYGVIGSWWGVNHREFNHELKSQGALETITVRLNTIGGTFYDGLPIFNILKQHPAIVTVKVMGYALSMGSIIMLAADRVEMAQNSLVMIHRAQGWAQGDAKEMRAVANRLETHEEAILPLYQQRMRLSEDAVRELLQNQTWYSAKRALAAGLIDAITDPIDLEEATKQIDANAWEKCMGDQCTMPDNYKQLVENIIYPKTALEKVLEFAVGKPAKPITLLENKEDLDMDKEELQKMLDAQSEKLEASFDEKLAEFKKMLTKVTRMN